MRNLIPQFIHEQFKRHVYTGCFEAATMSVDMSGFTPLTETMLQYQKDGAEVLTETLGSLFAPLVREAYIRGGLIPLFAGDAFIAVFVHDPEKSPDAPLHALKTAFYVKELLNPHGEDRLLQTKYGDFFAGVKVGLSYGTVSWGIPGQGGSYTFYFRGPAVNSCSRAERQATKGEIVVDEAILPFIQRHVTAVPTADSHFHKLTACTFDFPPPRNTPIPRFCRADLEPFVSSEVLGLKVEAEFREVCSVFICFDEPQDQELLHAIAAEVLSLSNRYGGLFGQMEFGEKGGLIVLAFGAPVAYENNLERAAEFLLTLRGQHLPVLWRAGMAIGLIWAGFRGGRERCEYGMVGDVVNQAARLALRAGWGEIWTNEAAFEGLCSIFWLDALGAFSLKGKREKVPVYRLAGKREPVERFYRGLMIGREAELVRLREAVEPIFQGRFAGIIYVNGEAGIGKSRLLHEFENFLKRKQVRWCYCPADAIRQSSLHPFKYFLRRYFRQSADLESAENRVRFDRLLDALRSKLSQHSHDTQPLEEELNRTRSVLAAMLDLRWEDSLHEQLDPRLRFENIMSAFANFIKVNALLQPVVLQLEDGHWFDEDSRKMIQVLTQALSDYPVAILCASRYQIDGSPYQFAVGDDVLEQALDLTSLSEAGIKALAEQVLEGEMAPELVRFLAVKTEGNPLFLEQLLLDMRERGVIGKGDFGRWSAFGDREPDVPRTIRTLLIGRLDRLMGEVKRVVQAAAVLGREFEVQVLSAMLRGERELLTKIKEAEEAQIWVALNELRYLFRHTLMRDAAYDMQMPARLRELHRLAAEAMKQIYTADLSPHYADLSYHYGQAEDIERERHYARLAGEQAVMQFANEEAVAFLSRALDLTPTTHQADRYALLLAREKVYDLRGEREAQARDLDALEEFIRAMTDEPVRAAKRKAEVALRKSNYAQVTSKYPAAIAAARAAVDQAQAAQDKSFEAAGYLQWAIGLWRLGDFQATRSQLERALPLARSSGSRLVEAEALRTFGNVFFYEGDYARAATYQMESLPISREIGDRVGEASALNNLGEAARAQGEYTAAKGYYEQRLQICREIGDRRGECVALANLGLIAHNLGDDETALEYCQRMVRITKEIGHRSYQAYAFHNLGHSLAAQGSSLTRRPDPEKGDAIERLDEAAHAYRQAIALRRELGEQFLAMESLAGLARVFLAKGDLSQAQSQVEEILRYIEKKSLDGTDEPLRVYWTCYQVLKAKHDRRARGILTTAHSLLRGRAAKIPDEETRRSFLQNVSVHREILKEVEGHMEK